MSLFEDFVNAELPLRTVMTTAALCGYSGDPNDAGAPAMIKTSPKGTVYLRDSDYTLWYKTQSTAGTWLMLGTSSSPVTAPASVEYYVDQVAGSDTNVGSAASPFQTIGKALGFAQSFSIGTFTIYVKKGTYAETVNVNSVTENRQTNTASINISGLDWDTVTPATGPSTGTFDGSTGKFATLTAAGWTANDLRGKFVYVSTGGSPYQGNYYPIASNTTTGIELALGSASGMVGRTFTIMTPAAVITKAVGATASVYAGLYTNLNLEHLTLNPGSTNCIYARGKVTATEVYMTGVSTPCIFQQAYTSTLTRCYLNGTSSGVIASFAADPAMYGTVMRGGTGWGWTGAGTIGSTTNPCIIENFTTMGVDGLCYAAAPRLIISANTEIRSCGKGVMNENIAWIQVGSASIINNTTIGFQSQDVLNRLGSIYFDAAVITGNGTDGVRLSGHCRPVQFANACNISSNGGYGINMAGADYGIGLSGNNVVAMSATTTMATNTSGDINLGSSAISVATLRADPNKTYIDAVKLNRAVSA